MTTLAAIQGDGWCVIGSDSRSSDESGRPIERNKIYNEFLLKPLDKMISSIIRRYKLYKKDMDFYEIHIDTHSFLIYL